MKRDRRDVRRSSLLIGLVALSLALPGWGAGDAIADETSPEVTVEVDTSNGTAAAKNGVSVFLIPGEEVAEGETISLPLLGSGVTNKLGEAKIDLSGEPIDVADLGDTGDDEADSFNTIVITSDEAGNFGSSHAELGLTDPGQDAFVEEGTGEPIPPARGRRIAAVDPNDPLLCDPTITPCASKTSDSTYRYVRVLAFNSAKGMHTDLTYTYTDSLARQTSIEVASSDGGWHAGQMMTERLERNQRRHWTQDGAYHKYVWANYLWYKWNVYYCPIPIINCRSWTEWWPERFAADLTDNNPDAGPGTPWIGVRVYDPPPFDYNPDHSSRLTEQNDPYVRATGRYKEYSMSFPVAGNFVTLGVKSTYGKITEMSWDAVSGCEGTRYLWGDGIDPGGAPIVEASCI